MSSTSIERCLDVIELLADRPDGMSLTEISGHLDVPKSGAHRLLNILIARGYLAQGATRQYRLTMRLVRLGFAFLAETGFAEICQPILNDLARKVGEFVRMTVVEGENLVWIAQSQGSRSSVVIDATMTDSIPLHAAATAKVWLATLPEERAVELVTHQGFGKAEDYGPNAVRSVQAFLEEMAKTRARGYGLNLEESEPGVASVAVAISRSDKKSASVFGTLSVGAPAFRASQKRLVGFVPDMRKAADELAALWPVLQESLAKGEVSSSERKAAAG
ncbi:IclR family transcriptional regulator [Pelagibius sp.]|uniref:IclR family transcriptional regulator n=1 Tax=Pelagibius sp. TaxID=1931238 RepID=UPI003BAEC0AE